MTVYPGTYTENVDVGKSVTIESEDGAEVTIVQAANPDDHVFEVRAGYVTISGFRIKGATGVDHVAGIYLNWVIHCNIRENEVLNNQYGISIYGPFQYGEVPPSKGNTFLQNTQGNPYPDNKIYLNNFLGNSKNVRLRLASDIWNSTEKITYTYNGNTYTNYLGNYWDDYTGSDADGDGIGDTPYSIRYDNDNYPLMQPWENYFAQNGKIKGIDISHWQGDIVWSNVYNAGYKFAFAKATGGTGFIDGEFEGNMIEGHNVGMLIGAYHFAYPEYNDPVDEAQFFVSVAGEYLREGYLRPVLDIENDRNLNSYPYKLGKEALSNWIHEFMSTVESETGVQPIIYVNKNYAKDHLDTSINQYQLWIAHWTCDTNRPPDTGDTGIWNNWDFWQYWEPEPENCGENSIPGINTNAVDLDVFNGDMSRLNTFVITKPSGEQVETATGTGIAYFTSDAGTIVDLTSVDELDLPLEGKPDIVFPHGFFSFNIIGLTPGQTVVVTITLPDNVPVGTEYWKYHASEGGWIRIPMGSDQAYNNKVWFNERCSWWYYYLYDRILQCLCGGSNKCRDNRKLSRRHNFHLRRSCS
jgi:GH25 family lysozyme M1 (1,4-beta-N-acetylmuramidase)